MTAKVFLLAYPQDISVSCIKMDCKKPIGLHQVAEIMKQFVSND